MDTNADFKTNYHTHTFRCHHASGSDEEYVLEAIANGYKVLGFSDHACWEYSSKYVSRIRMRVQEFEEYKRSVLYLKEKYKDIHIVAVEPASSPVLSGGVPAPHKIQGIGAGFVPSILDTKIFNEILQVTNEEAFGMARTIASKEGLLVGISSGANVYAAKMLAKKYPNANILTMLNDTGERYLSTELFEGGE